MRNFLTLDSSAFPIVILKYHDFVPTLEELLLAQRQVEDFISANQNYVQLIDFSEMPYLSSEFRILQSKWQEKHKATYARQKIKVVFFAPGLLTRIMLKGLFAINKPGVPCVVVSTKEKALAWANQQVAISLRNVQVEKLADSK
jgi:hypothetical protein